MTKTLYVGNLPWTTNEEELNSLFAAHAQLISARIITDRATGRSKGFGFVEVEDADADKVVKTMNGYSMGGRALVVNEARPRQPKEER